MFFEPCLIRQWVTYIVGVEVIIAEDIRNHEPRVFFF
jgi:hypothetical protein